MFRLQDMALLEGLMHLKELALAWFIEERPPDLAPFPELETLRLYIRCPAAHNLSVIYYSPECTVYRNLTTLHIRDNNFADWLSYRLDRFAFPALRVLHLQNIATPVSWIYAFIHRHPTLRDVNFSLHPDVHELLSLDALIKLIDGTGTWGQLVQGEDAGERDHGLPDELNVKGHVDKVFLDWRSEASRDHPLTIFTAFAFSRVHLFPDATKWDQPVGSPEPRYAATELALSIIENKGFEFHFCVITIQQFLERMPERFPLLETLRLRRSGMDMLEPFNIAMVCVHQFVITQQG